MALIALVPVSKMLVLVGSSVYIPFDVRVFGLGKLVDAG